MARKSARNNQDAPVPKPLLVVAGLPRSTAATIGGTISKQRNVNVVSAPFGEGGEIYSAAAIRTLMVRAAEFALRDRKGAPVSPIPDPSRLMLAYVAAGGCEQLIDAFGVSAQLLPLQLPEWDYPLGQDWRSLIEPVSRVTLAALDGAGGEPFRAIRAKLEAKSTREVLLLPPRNFETPAGPLYDRLIACLRGQLEMADVGDGIVVRRFPFEELEEFYRKAKVGDNRWYPVDQRGLVFPSGAGPHGGGRTIPADPKPSIAEVRALLETIFRMGTPLTEGFQHDVQWPEKRKLDEERFVCSRDGPVKISGSHANVYPNDYIREASKGSKAGL